MYHHLMLALFSFILGVFVHYWFIYLFNEFGAKTGKAQPYPQILYQIVTQSKACHAQCLINAWLLQNYIIKLFILHIFKYIATVLFTSQLKLLANMLIEGSFND